MGSRPSTTFRWLHWTLTALAALSFAIGLFHLGSDAFWYVSASMVLATAVATANLVRLWLAQRRNRPAQTYAGGDHWWQAAGLNVRHQCGGYRTCRGQGERSCRIPEVARGWPVVVRAAWV